MSERVWCVPAELVHASRRVDGFWRWDLEALDDAFVGELNTAGRFLPRAEVETDETWRQVIPYVILRSPTGGYFTYRRLPASGEERLVDLHSIGVGGHINDDHLLASLTAEPGLAPNLIADGLHRELREELTLPELTRGLGRLELHGFLALSDTAVDRVHVGVVVIAHIAAEHVAGCGVREADKLEAVGWYQPAELSGMLNQVAFEGWSQALIEAGLP